MYVGCKDYKTESLSKFFSYISRGILACILIAGCAERPAGMVDVDNVPPTVTIVSPSKIDTSQIPSKSSKIKSDEKISISGSAIEGRNSAALITEDIPGVRKGTVEKPAANRKVDNRSVSRKSNNGIYKKGAELVFKGEVVDVEEDSLSEASLRWTSDIDEEIGKGYSFTKSDLSAGEHQIVLYATDSEGGVGRDTVSIFIEEQSVISGNHIPIVKILSLEEGWNLLNTAELILRGTADDPEEGELEGESLLWKSSIDGVLGTGSLLDVTGKLALGDHTITLMATDSEGATGKFNVNISIADKIDDTVNNSPVANILNNDGILNLLDTEVLSLEASASDPDGEIVSMAWSSDIDGKLGTGTTLEKPAADLTLGVHTITFTATDDDGASGSDSVELTIEEDLGETINKLPTAEILNVDGILNLLETEFLSLEASTSDSDGEIALMVWSSDKDGELERGATLEISAGDLTLGDHTITFTATDDDGAKASDSVELTIEEDLGETINKLPVAEILNVDGILTLLNTELLSLEGSASDPDGEIVSMTWISDSGEILGTGTTLEIPASELSLGNHTITFEAKDNDGAKASDSVEVTIEKNQLPVADILSLGGVLLETDDLILEGSGSDEEDGSLGGESLVWSSNIGGELGTGGTLDVTGKLSIGDHTITLTAIDSEGATGSDEVTITVNLAPPTSLTAEAKNSTTVQLSWQDNSNKETNFVIEQNSEVILKPDKNVTSFEVTNLLESTSYKFRVAAEDNNGRSEFSELVTVETLPAQITRFVSADNTLDSLAAGDNISDGTLPVGKILEGTTYRVALAFSDLQDDVSGRIIEKAVLRLYKVSILEGIDLAVNAFIESWDPTKITWNAHIGKFTLDHQSKKSILLNTEEPIEFDITPIVKNWASGSWGVNGLLVRSLSDPLVNTAEFESLESSTPEEEPQIFVDFGD